MATQQPPEPPAPAAKADELPVSAVIEMHSDPRFLLLKQRLYRFIFPMSIAFLAWYLLYVLLSAFARDLMSTQVVGSLNLALLLGVLQFVTTFGIAIAYSSYSRKHLDPAAADVRAALDGKGGSA